MPNMMTVIQQDKDGVSRFASINLNDVDYIKNDGRRPIIHIGEEEYYLISNKSELEELLSSQGFDALDRSNLVNIKKIRYFDREYGKVFFEENPDKHSKYALVARIKYTFVEKFIRRAVANNKGTTIEYKEAHPDSSFVGKLKGLFME